MASLMRNAPPIALWLAVIAVAPRASAGVPAPVEPAPAPAAQTSSPPPAAAAAETQLAAAADAPNQETDCNFGIAVWCLSESPRKPNPPRTKFRLEVFAGYKLSNSYYRAEERACTAAGCTLDFRGASFSGDIFYNVAGSPHGDDSVDVGVSASYMPIVSSIRDNQSGFDGELGRVRPGDGSLAYVPIRLTVRRTSFLFLIKSKYLISAFGVGVAIPVTTGAGDSFTGADGLKATVGGRLGVQLPITDVVQIGLATNWTVVWYGGVFDASFQSSYGLNLAYQR